MTVGDVLFGVVELLVPGLLVLGAVGWLVNRGKRVPTPREGGGTQAHQQAARSALPSSGAGSTGQ